MVVPNLELNNGFQMPQFGLGTWLSKPEEVSNSIKHAIKHGYRLVDCAFVYQNQREIGNTFKELFKQGVVKRDELFITSKIWNTYHSEAKAKHNLDMILDELGLEYLDLCLIHWPMGYKEDTTELFPKGENGENLFSDVDYMETWRVLEKAVLDGKVRTIGLSNFNIPQIRRVLENCKIKPAVLQVEAHVYFQQKEIVNFCNDNGLRVTAYSPLGNPEWRKISKTTDYPSIFDDKKISKIAEAHNKTNAQIALKFLIQRGLAIIPKSTNEARIAENFNIFDFTITEKEMKQLEGLDTGKRVVALVASKHSKFYPF